MQLHPLIIEIYSLVMKKTIEGDWDVPWNIRKELKKINQMKENFNVIFQQVLREDNTVVDYLANIAFSGVGTITFQSFQEFPNTCKTLINQDKSQIPNLRVRTAKRIPPDSRPSP